MRDRQIITFDEEDLKDSQKRRTEEFYKKRKIKILDETPFVQFKRVPSATYEPEFLVKSFGIKRESNDEEYERLKDEGKTFLITNPEAFNKRGVRTPDGIFGKGYGPDPMKSDADEYSCECGHLTTGAREGDVCPKCGYKVEFIVPDTTRRAYIDTGKHKVLTFHGYYNFRKILGEKAFEEILKASYRLDTKGNIKNPDIVTISTLYENYDELYYPKIGIEKKYIFTSKISVYHPSLRPWFKRGNTIQYSEVNKYFSAIVTLVNDLRFSDYVQSKPQTLKNINAIHRNLFLVYKYILTKTKGKTGMWVTSATSGKMDYSARHLIVAGVDLKPHQVLLPYTTIMEMWEEELVRLYSKLEKVPVHKALSKHAMAMNRLDKKFMNIIEIFLKTEEVWTIIDRNPTIKHGSILYMQVAGFHKDMNNKTMAVPLDIIVAQAADFDGDQESNFAQKFPVESPYSTHEILKRTFCPTYMFIDGATGYFNTDSSFKKDQISIISEIWNLSETIGEYLNQAEFYENDRTPNIRKIDAYLAGIKDTDYFDNDENVFGDSIDESNMVYVRH